MFVTISLFVSISNEPILVRLFGKWSRNMPVCVYKRESRYTAFLPVDLAISRKTTGSILKWSLKVHVRKDSGSILKTFDLAMVQRLRRSLGYSMAMGNISNSHDFN